MILKRQVHRLWLGPPASADDSPLFNAGVLGRAELEGSKSVGARALRSPWSRVARVRSGTRISINRAGGENGKRESLVM